MVPYFILGIALLVGLLLAGRWFAGAEPKAIVKVLKWLVLTLVGVVVVFFLVTGRFAWALAALPVLLPWFLRFRSLARMAKTFSRMSGAQGGAAGGGQASEVETRYLRMSLDHASGNMDGAVKEGAFVGRLLSGMTLEELAALMQTCWVEDEQSAQVLEAYLDRVHANWRDHLRANDAGGANGGEGFAKGGMTRDEAYQILGLQAGAGEDEIKAAHHRLMSGLHPDHGGSTYLASKLNQAKDRLIGG